MYISTFPTTVKGSGTQILLIAFKPVALVLFAAGSALESSVTVKHSAGKESKESMGARLYWHSLASEVPDPAQEGREQN
jgi:hypothetical protein